jgi:hypothetical protein
MLVVVSGQITFSNRIPFRRSEARVELRRLEGTERLRGDRYVLTIPCLKNTLALDVVWFLFPTQVAGH